VVIMTEKTKTEIREKFADEEYPIRVIGRHISITDPMKSYAVDKLKKILDRFGARIIEANIIMDVQKLMHAVDFLLLVNNTRIKVIGQSENMYTSIDQAITRLGSKLSRYKRRLREHHAKGVSTVDMNVNVIQRIDLVDEINDQIEEETMNQIEEELTPHAVVSQEKKPLKTLNLEEAIMKMELSEDLFMIYRSEAERKLKVIYRRNDGNYGIIELEA
jgi:putative sigma-54 modulation protein